MSGFIMFLLIIGVIYIAFTYLKGSRNTDTYRDTFNMKNFNGDTWNEEVPPELLEDDETEMEADGKDMEEIGFEADDAEAGRESEAPVAKLPAVPAASVVSEAPASPPVPEAPAASALPASPAVLETPAAPAPAAALPEAPPVDGVIVDSEVCIDAKMPSDNK